MHTQIVSGYEGTKGTWVNRRRISRSEGVHVLLVAGVLLAALNSINILVFHFNEDVVTYSLTAVIFSFAALSQVLTRPVGPQNSLRLRWTLWGVFLLFQSLGFLATFIDQVGITHTDFTARLTLFSAAYAMAYVTIVNPHGGSGRRGHWLLSTLIAIILGGIFLLVEIHTEGDRADGRLVFVTVLQAVFMVASLLARRTSTKLAERRLATRMAAYFAASFLVCVLCNGAAIYPWVPGARFACAFFPLDALTVLAVTVVQISGAQRQPVIPKALPSSVTVLFTAALLLACIPLLHWHLNLGIALVIIATGLFAVRLSVMENDFDQEREAFTQGNPTLLELASTDSLTGIANRRCFMEALTKSVGRVQQGEGSFLLAIFDLDNLKQINDHQGHLVGDDCIKEFAQTVSRSVAPPFDCFARLGGDEFTLLLADSDLHDCRTTVQEIRSALANTQIRFSVGVAVCTPASPLSPTELLAEADANLYRAKRSGGISRQLDERIRQINPAASQRF